MKLRNGFTNETRLLYLGHWACFLCGCNGWGRGGLEIHHILGRTSNSPFNSSCLCGECHRHIGHKREEHQRIFYQTVQHLKNQRYKPTEEDWRFLHENFEELVGGNGDKIIKALSR